MVCFTIQRNVRARNNANGIADASGHSVNVYELWMWDLLNFVWKVYFPCICMGKVFDVDFQQYHTIWYVHPNISVMVRNICFTQICEAVRDLQHVSVFENVPDCFCNSIWPHCVWQYSHFPSNKYLCWFGLWFANCKVYATLFVESHLFFHCTRTCLWYLLYNIS